MFRAAIVFLGLVGAASAGQFLKKERELTVEEQLAQLRKENADMRASLETYRLAVEKVSEDYVTWRPHHSRLEARRATESAVSDCGQAAGTPLHPFEDLFCPAESWR